MHRALFSARRGPVVATGPAVVFLHGLTGSGRYWYRVADRLRGAGRELRLVDLLGFGRSPWPDGDYTLAEHLAALDAWRATAGLADRPLVLVGHSLGALLAPEWATHTPHVRGAVLIGLPVYPDVAAARRALAHLSLLHRLTLGARPLAQGLCLAMYHTRPLWRLLAPLLAPHVPPAVARDGVLHTWRSFSGTLEHVVFGLPAGRVAQLAAGLPLLLVHGAADRTAPAEAVRALAARLPRGRLDTIAGGGHDVPLTHPLQVAGAIRVFVAARDARDWSGG